MDPAWTIDAQTLDEAAAVIRRGELVVFPTETVYGLGANAFDARAVAGVFALKGRPRFDPLIVHLADVAQLADLAAVIPADAWRLAEEFWPGPLTLVLPKRSCVPDLVTADLPTVAVRLPDHPVARQLIRAAGVPLAAPSANRFGRVSPTTAQHVRDSFGDQTPLVLDAGPCRVGIESTVVSLLGERPRLLRPGGIPREAIERLAGPIAVAAAPHAPGPQGAAAPGMLSSHYAPQAPLRLAPHAASPAAAVRPPDDRAWGLLCLQAPAAFEGFAAVETLAPDGDLRTAAANLFAALRRLEKQPLAGIYALPVAEEGLGAAIMDRLRRAAADRPADA